MNPARGQKREWIMHKLTRGILLAGAMSMAASLALPNPAFAEVNHTAGMPAHCYQWPTERLDVAWMAGVTAHTETSTVTDGSPCRDINVRAVLDVDSKAACRTMRVAFADGRKGKWRKVCKKWVVLSYGATEGAGFVIEAKGRPSSVQVRS